MNVLQSAPPTASAPAAITSSERREESRREDRNFGGMFGGGGMFGMMGGGMQLPMLPQMTYNQGHCCGGGGESISMTTTQVDSSRFLSAIIGNYQHYFPCSAGNHGNCDNCHNSCRFTELDNKSHGGAGQLQ